MLDTFSMENIQTSVVVFLMIHKKRPATIFWLRFVNVTFVVPEFNIWATILKYMVGRF